MGACNYLWYAGRHRADGKAREEMEDMAQTLNTIRDHPTKLPEILATASAVKTSSAKRWGNEYLSISCDTWRPRYTDKSTGEIMRDDLVQAATMDEQA